MTTLNRTCHRTGQTLLAVGLVLLGAQLGESQNRSFEPALGEIVKAESAQAARSRRIRYKSEDPRIRGEVVTIVVPPRAVAVTGEQGRLVQIGSRLWVREGGEAWGPGPSLLEDQLDRDLGPIRADDWRAALRSARALGVEEWSGRPTRVYAYETEREGEVSRVRVSVDPTSGLPVHYQREWVDYGTPRAESWTVEYDARLYIDPPPTKSGRVTRLPPFAGNYPPMTLPTIAGGYWPPALDDLPAIVVRGRGAVQVGPRLFSGAASVRAGIAELVKSVSVHVSLPLYAADDAPWSTLEPVLDALSATGMTTVGLVSRGGLSGLGGREVMLGGALSPPAIPSKALRVSLLPAGSDHLELNGRELAVKDVRARLTPVLQSRSDESVDLTAPATARWGEVVAAVDVVSSAGGLAVLNTSAARARRFPREAR